MKTRNLFLSLFAFAAICACNKEAQPEVPQVLGEDACLSVRIMAADVNTKASGDFELGSSAENAVSNVLFAFFSADGKFMYAEEVPGFEWDNGETNPNVEDYSNVKVVLDGTNIAPRQMVVVLNYNNDILTAINTITDISDMYDVVTTNAYSLASTTNFVMTNSSYANNSGENMFAAKIDEGDIHKVDVAATPEQIVDVYVERVAAKLSVETSGLLETESRSLDLHNGSTIKYYPHIVGYAFTGTKDASYLCKNIEGLYTTDDFNDNWLGWNDPTNKRSYWGVSYPSATSVYVDYDNVTNSSPYSVYCHENMTNAKTKLMVSAVIRKQLDDANQDPATDPVLSLVKVGATYYLEDELEAAIVAELHAAGAYWNDGSTNQNYDASHIDYTPIEGAGSTGYEVQMVLTKPEASTDKVASVMEKYAKVVRWNGGQCYFSKEVAHLGNATTTPASDFGVVRNHVYKLTVNKIAGLGTPYVPGIGGDGNDPVVPSDIEYQLEARINILKWKVVEQGVSFE